MGHRIIIGQKDKYQRQPYPLCIEGAPDGTGINNQYSNVTEVPAHWLEWFAARADLREFFYGKMGVMRTDKDIPGYVKITKCHQTAIHRCHTWIHKIHTTDFDKKNRAMVDWLRFWIDWSLENCTNPVFYND